MEKLGGLRVGGDENLSVRSRRSSSFHMVGPTAPTVSRMRIASVIEDLSPDVKPRADTNEMVGIGLIPTNALNTPYSKDRSPGYSSRKRRRLFSDVDGLTPPGTFSRLNSINEFDDQEQDTFVRAGSFVENPK